MKIFLCLLLVLAVMIPQFVFAEENERVEASLAGYWENRARQHEAIARQQRARVTYYGAPVPEGQVIPLWVAYNGEEAASTEEGAADAEKPNKEGKKELELEDVQLWASMDLDKDGKLTVAEFEKFASSPNAQAFVQQMKQNKAVEAWAAKAGMDVEQAKAAIAAGANAERRQQYMTQQYYARLQAQRRRAAIARRNQQIYQARQRQQNYWSRLGDHINPQMQQQYYAAMRRQQVRRRQEL